jgi:hypothetical protein
MSHKTGATVARTIGIHTGKNTLHLIGLDDKGAIVLREKIPRGRITTRLANVPRCPIGIEAGMATHYVARELSALGHDVKQVPPAYAKPFRQGHKNDFRDAYAVAEAVQRISTRYVPVKTDDQLDLQALHRAISPGRPTNGCDQSEPRGSIASLSPRAALFRSSPISRDSRGHSACLERANRRHRSRMATQSAGIVN